MDVSYADKAAVGFAPFSPQFHTKILIRSIKPRT
ncbi:MAG: hypothetical protein ACI9U6_001586, partial [Loktanella salsilacus]